MISDLSIYVGRRQLPRRFFSIASIDLANVVEPINPGDVVRALAFFFRDVWHVLLVPCCAEPICIPSGGVGRAHWVSLVNGKSRHDAEFLFTGTTLDAVCLSGAVGPTNRGSRFECSEHEKLMYKGYPKKFQSIQSTASV